VVENFRIYADAPKAISVISYGELVFGAEKSAQRGNNLAKVHRLREVFPVIDLSCSIMDTFGSIKAEVERKGNSVDDFDLLIGATALTLGYCVVSNNEKYFKMISGLKLDNWTYPVDLSPTY
jgi:tRNA(fMet)-specific endonuclease VapC